jgi:hypothetical protein
VSYFDLVDYYKTLFILTNTKKLSLIEVENMYPWEYEIYLNMLKEYLEEEAQKKQEELSRKSMG